MSENPSPAPADIPPSESLTHTAATRLIADHADATGNDVLLGVSFGNPFRAEEFVLALQGLASKGGLILRDVVVVTKDGEGRVRGLESVDMTPVEAAVRGAMWSGLLGLLIAGPLGWVAGIGIGAGAGALTAKVIDTGIPDEWVDWFKQAVQPLTATVVALVSDVDLGALRDEALRFEGAHLMHTTLSPQSQAHLADAFGDPGPRSG